MEREAQADLEKRLRSAKVRPRSASRSGSEPARPSPFAPGVAEALRRQRLVQVAALGLFAVLCLLGLLVLLSGVPETGQAQGLPTDTAKGPPPLFRGWDRPDVVLVLSGQQRGYLQPCGCSTPQYGGLARRYNFVQGLKQRGWPVVLVDVGDLAQRQGPQKMLKYVTSMKALNLLDYTAVGLGQSEMAMPTLEALAHYTLNNPTPAVVAANLLNRDKGQLFDNLVQSWEIGGKNGGPKVGVAGLIGPSVQEQVKDPDARFHKGNAEVLRSILTELKARKVPLVVLLYQGSLKEATTCAHFCAEERTANPTLPRVDVILCLSEEDEPPGTPDRVGQTLLVRVGHKGRYVGVIGAFRSNQPQQPYELRYQLAVMGPELETPKGKEGINPIMALMEEYTREVKDRNYLAQYPRSVHGVQVAFPQAKYVGSERCSGCHKDAFKIWEGTAHSHAYAKLTDAKHPSLRQFDGECVVCHTVGFGYRTGFVSETATAHLEHVGCESCHGPSSEHVKNTRNPAIHKVINPWKADTAKLAAAQTQEERTLIEHRRLLQIDKFCQSCHDTDNDVHWKFEKNWPQIVHMMPRQARPAAPVPAPAVQPGIEVQDIQPAPPQEKAAPTRPGPFRLFRSKPGDQ